MRDRGVTVVEVLTTLLLAAFLVQVGWTIAEAQRGVVGSLLLGADATETARIAGGVLRRELRGGRPGPDWSVVGADSVTVRTFRGSGLRCETGRDSSEVTVIHRGGVRPRAGRDSVLALLPTGSWTAHLLAGWEGGESACPAEPHSRVERWLLEPPPTASPVLLRLYRRGSYHLTGGGLRYRRGHGGRQPLTPLVLDDRLSALEPGPGDRVLLTLRFRSLASVPGLNPRTFTIWPGDS